MVVEEKPLRKEYLYRGTIVTLRRDEAVFPDGKKCRREVVEHPGAVCVLCVQAGKVALVKQYRYACGEALWEVPAGKLIPGEDPAAAAARELEEETGVKAERLALLSVFYSSPGFSNEKIYLFRAEGMREGESHPDEDEFLDVAWVPLEEARAMAERGEIRDAKTLVALLRIES